MFSSKQTATQIHSIKSVECGNPSNENPRKSAWLRFRHLKRIESVEKEINKKDFIFYEENLTKMTVCEVFNRYAQ